MPHRASMRVAVPLSALVVVSVSSLAAQGRAAAQVELARTAAEVSHDSGTAGHHVVFSVTNAGTETSTYDLGCLGVGRVRCAGLKHGVVTLAPGQRQEVVAFYEVTAAGRGVLVLTVLNRARAARAQAQLAVRVRP